MPAGFKGLDGFEEYVSALWHASVRHVVQP
jgi:hypothetical protein